MIRTVSLALALMLAIGGANHASAQDWQPEERLIVPIPDGWAPVGTDTLDSGRMTVYRSAVEPGSDQIGVQRFFGIVDQAPRDVAARMLEGLPESCRQGGGDLATPPDRNGRPLAIVSVVCRPETQDGAPPDVIEVSRALVLVGDEDLHIVTRVWQGPPGGPDDPTDGSEAASAWTRFFDAIAYCSAAGC